MDEMSDFGLPSMIRAVFVDGTSDVVDEKTTRKLRCQCPPEGGMNDTEGEGMNDTEGGG